MVVFTFNVFMVSFFINFFYLKYFFNQINRLAIDNYPFTSIQFWGLKESSPWTLLPLGILRLHWDGKFSKEDDKAFILGRY